MQLFRALDRPTATHGTIPPGRPLRAPQAGREPRLRAVDGVDAGARDRREQRHLQRRQRRRPAAAGVSGPWPADVHHQPVSRSRLRSVLGLGAGIPRVPRLEPVRSTRSAPTACVRPTSERERPTASRHGARHQRADAHPRRPAAHRTHLHATKTRCPNAEDVAILSDSLWRESFNADTSVVGRTLKIDGVTDADRRGDARRLRRPRSEGRALAAADHQPAGARQSWRPFPVSRRSARTRDDRGAGARRSRSPARKLEGDGEGAAHTEPDRPSAAHRQPAGRHDRQRQAIALGASGRGRLRAAHRLREPRQPAARPRRLPPSRVRRAIGAGRRTRSARPPVRDRRGRHCRARWRARRRPGLVRPRGAARRVSRQHPALGGDRSRLASAGVHARRGGRDRRRVRPRAAAALEGTAGRQRAERGGARARPRDRRGRGRATRS